MENRCPDRCKIADVALQISKALDGISHGDEIQLCGDAALMLLPSRPQDVLLLAQEKLHTYRFVDVPKSWLRLYEDASLHLAAHYLSSFAQDLHPVPGKPSGADNDTAHVDLFACAIEHLDKAIIISGAPRRRDLVEVSFRRLEDIIVQDPTTDAPCRFEFPRLAPLKTLSPVTRPGHAISLEVFQLHLQTTPLSPLVLPGVLDGWPASDLWQDLSYIRRRTLGGRRIVPVEIGQHYMDHAWAQKLMTFNEFADRFLSPAQPIGVGYLAQHDLFTQIPALKMDIVTPDYCWTVPPQATGVAAHTAGLSCTPRLEEPLMNAWLGPKGTKTPLHTDPYHNIFCQVVGYKYVRLYSPEQTGALYPAGLTDSGIDMNNTSQVDASALSPHFRDQLEDAEIKAKLENINKNFPLFRHAKYQETILAPGECLYIPLGWWHYLESLTTSFSVSFWWN